MIWTDNRREAFKQLWVCGWTLADIADYFECSFEATKRQRILLQLPSRHGGAEPVKWDDARTTKLITCWKTGATLKQIASDMGMGLSAMKVKLAQLGLYRRGKDNHRSQKINVRISHQLLDDCRFEASKRGMGIAPYIRSLIEKDLAL